MDASIWMQANILKGVNLSFPPQVGERPASPILELRYYTFAELSNRTDDENLQLNIVLFQGSLFNGLSIFASPNRETYLLSYRKLKGRIKTK